MHNNNNKLITYDIVLIAEITKGPPFVEPYSDFLRSIKIEEDFVTVLPV